MKRISEIMDPTEIDYIVCNHMEKDHAGSIERIVEVCRPEKIFCSAMGEKSMKAQFNTEGWPIQVVKDGERLNIGKRNITFLEPVCCTGRTAWFLIWRKIRSCFQTMRSDKRCDKQPLC